MLEFNIRNQEISRIDGFSPAEKSVGYLVAKFNFKTEDWNGASKIAVFKNLKTKEEYDRKLEEDACIVPSEALSEKGQFEVSVYGLKDGQKITSNVATCNLNRTLSGGSMIEDDSLNAAEKLLLEAQNKLDKSGHAPNKFLGTDEQGNVVTKEQEEFSLEVAREEKLGGVKPLNKTDDMTLEVGVDKDGRLFAKGKGITVDSELDQESTNPVQNKVLTKEVITLKEHNTQLKETIEKLQIKTTTEKASFHNIKDSANMKVVDFGMEGKTTQDGTPTPENQVEIVNAGVYNEETGRYEHRFYAGNKNLLKLTGRNVLPEQDSPQTVAREFTGNQIFLGISANNYMQPRIVKNYSIDDNSITLTTSGSNQGLGFDVPVKEGQTYIISDDNNNVNIKVGFFDSEGNYLSYLTLTGKSFTIPTGASWLLVVFLSATTTETNITNIQLELDTVATELVIHQSQQFTLTSPVPLTKWDKLVKRDGVWGWSVQAKEYVYDGTEFDLNSNDYNSKRMRAYITLATAPKNTECRCNMFRYHTTEGVVGTCGYWFKNSFCMYISNSWLEPYGYAYNPDDGNSMFTNARKAFKAMLADKGNIRILVNMQEEQAFHPLPDNEQTLLNSLETYYGVTNLYNDQGCPTWLTYIADPKLYLDNQLLEIKSAIV